MDEPVSFGLELVEPLQEILGNDFLAHSRFDQRSERELAFIREQRLCLRHVDGTSGAPSFMNDLERERVDKDVFEILEMPHSAADPPIEVLQSPAVICRRMRHSPVFPAPGRRSPPAISDRARARVGAGRRPAASRLRLGPAETGNPGRIPR